MSQEIDFIEADIEAVNLGNLNTVEFDLNLPTHGENGSKITWESSDTRFIKRTGKVIQPRHGAGKRLVTLRGCFAYGGAYKEKIYNVTVLEEYEHIVITYIHPVVVQAQIDTPISMPSVAIVETADNEIFSHTVDWQGVEEPRFSSCGKFTIQGKLLNTKIPVLAHIVVKAIKEEELIDKEPFLQGFSTGITLTKNSSFYQAQTRMREYLLQCNDDQMLYNFRYVCGLDLHGSDSMIGWDTIDSKLRGHTTGHYLSALALCYRATKDESIKNKAIYMIQELRKCQIASKDKMGFGKGYLCAFDETQFELLEQFSRYPIIWAPYYTLHKIFAGVLDCYELLGIQEALSIACDLGDYVYHRLRKRTNATLKKMWGIYIAGEYGGMNESLAKLYHITGNIHHLQAARMFDNDRLFIPMQRHIDALSSMHVNQHIPQIIGAFEIFKYTKEKRYYDIAKNFWDIVVEHHTYTNGGIGEGEIFHAPDTIALMIDDNTAETCASYNILKLTKELYQYDPNVSYMDYYERVMINHIQASEYQSVLGGTTYFLPMEPGSKKSFEDENNCCHGTGMENPFKYIESMYFHTDTSIYVNLFMKSSVKWDKKDIEIRQVVEEDKPGDIRLSVSGKGTFTMYIRIPYWTNKQTIQVAMNQQPLAFDVENGYIIIQREWCDDILDIHYPCFVYVEHLKDDYQVISLHYGPYVLVALDDSQEYLTIELQNDLHKQFIKEDNNLLFHEQDLGLTCIPLYQVKEEHYHVYMKI